MRVGVAAADPAVARGLRRVFARDPGVEVVPLTPDPAGDGQPSPPDVLVVDVWPPTAAAAEDQCGRWHARFPPAAIVAIVHRPSDGLLRRLAGSGVRTLWPKGDARGLVPVVRRMTAERGAASD